MLDIGSRLTVRDPLPTTGDLANADGWATIDVEFIWPLNCSELWSVGRLLAAGAKPRAPLPLQTIVS
jgi:hypothetical protein